MPWLEKGNEDESQNLLFVHVPRCGGTSLMIAHNVPRKATVGASWFHKLGMTIFFHRYKLLESTNFPIYTSGNAACIACLNFFAYLRFAVLAKSDPVLQYMATFFMVFFLALLIGLSFVFVAPTIARVVEIRRSYLILVHYVLCQFMENIEYITGTNRHGYLPHLTAHKMLNYGYVTPKEMENSSTMAIVRNPYSRMVSLYMYNRFGPLETFEHFVRSWYEVMKYYRETGEVEEWYTPCHVLPQFEFTHFQGTQLVQSIVKQEELAFLVAQDTAVLAVQQDSSVADLPTVVRESLLGVPHVNRRTTEKPWYEFYNQETLNLTFSMYRQDFEVFDYPVSLHQRPELKPPVPLIASIPLPKKFEKMQRDTSSTSSLNSGISQEFRSSLRRQSVITGSQRSSMMSTLESLSVAASEILSESTAENSNKKID
ncbi:sulfotransferase family protein [Nitzschia inconspicua]|uniref:Sulfotransferase family protein n=1 Tax=Nitzschia inconspicua TaxID=303405 RepID=A0A9K3LPG5_9STRA|nr:sulfotransferase family protein [Nitzschia inconspicua]